MQLCFKCCRMQHMKRVTVTADEAQIERWKEAAHIRRTTMSAWMRAVLDATAKHTIDKEATGERRS